MQTAINNVCNSELISSSLDLQLVVTDRNILTYLAQFEDDELQRERALEALKVGVIAIQSASPTLDTEVVQAKFAEVESRMMEQLSDFQTKVTGDLVLYFSERDGVVPRSIDGVFGDKGALARTFQSFFDPTDGRLSRLIQAQVGPQSNFGKILDPQNKQGVIALIETRVQELVEAKLDEVLEQFSLDDTQSAMSKLHAMLSGLFGQLNQSLGIRAATAAEAAKGHIKGIVFEEDVYTVFAETGRAIGDDTECVRGTIGAIPRCKKGDFVATLGESSGAPGQKIVVEVKDQPLRLRDALDELQEAKKNRGAALGIFVFARGVEPAEIGDFRRIGEDFYVTVDKDHLSQEKPLLYLDSAYTIARAMAVAATRKESAGQVDLQKIEDQVNALTVWSDRIADIATKARTIQSSGKLIEQFANDLKLDLDGRIALVMKMLQKSPL